MITWNTTGRRSTQQLSEEEEKKMAQLAEEEMEKEREDHRHKKKKQKTNHQEVWNNQRVRDQHTQTAQAPVCDKNGCCHNSKSGYQSYDDRIYWNNSFRRKVSLPVSKLCIDCKKPIMRDYSAEYIAFAEQGRPGRKRRPRR